MPGTCLTSVGIGSVAPVLDTRVRRSPATVEYIHQSSGRISASCAAKKLTPLLSGLDMSMKSGARLERLHVPPHGNRRAGSALQDGGHRAPLALVSKF